jgi:glycosyltransferase involved in cell wall biosynthesis
MIRVGFHYNFSKNSWLGGTIYLKNLFEGINDTKNIKIKPVIITDFKCTKKDLSYFKGIEVIRSNLFSRSNFNRIINKIIIVIFGKNFFVQNFLLKNNIQALSHFSILGKKSIVPSIYWQPDFQEHNNSQYISFRRRLFRKFNIFFFANHSSKVLLSSNTVKKELKKINFQAYKKSEVLRPTFSNLSNNSYKSFKYLKRKFKIKGNYFFLPNHFWSHKNHVLVLKSLINLKKKNELKDIKIVCTGLFSDYRNPKHKDKIIKIIKDNNLENNFIILGIVSEQELMSLMKFSIAVINPSKSEGWSSTVEQAKSLGKFVLVSNLTVHKEQNPRRSFFFKVDDDFKLSKKILHMSKQFSIKKELAIIKKEANSTIIRKTNFIINYEKLINKVIKFKS